MIGILIDFKFLYNFDSWTDKRNDWGIKILTIDKIQRNLNILGTGIVN